jgi:DNA-binding transcriptional MerR regulator
MQGFRAAQTEALTGVNPKTLHYWDRSGFLSPSIAQAAGTGTRRLYSFQDLVALRVAHELRESGISLQALRRVVRFLHDYKRVEQPMAETFLVTDGLDVYAKRGNAVMSVLREPGQGLLFHVVNLSRVVGQLREAIVQLCPTAKTSRTRAPSQVG